MSVNRTFIPAKPSPLLLGLVQRLNSFELSGSNRLHVDEAQLDYLRQLPADAGVVLTPNHADEVDPRICMELSRRSGRKFIFMCNREAFDEYWGLAGWLLQRLGLFSVERGAHDVAARQYSVDVIKQSKNVLVIFPEGEIYYLNDVVQRFHTGAVQLCMEAIMERRRENSQWTAFLVPMAIKYRYNPPVSGILQERIKRMETHLGYEASGEDTINRLRAIVRRIIETQELSHRVSDPDPDNQELTQHISVVRRAILAKLEDKYDDHSIDQRATIDASWALSARLREMLAEAPTNSGEIRQDLSSLHEVAHLVSLQPSYYASNPSGERLAEVVLKLERELYGIKRPKQLGRRDVFVQLEKPIDIGAYAVEFDRNPHVSREHITSLLHDKIQRMIDDLSVKSKQRLM